MCRRLNVLLSRTIGSIGANTLFTRALRAAEAEAPVLAGLSLGSGEEPFEQVDEVRTEHGAQALATALEAFLEILLALLSRFIGDDIVAALAEVDHDPTDEAHGDEKELA